MADNAVLAAVLPPVLGSVFWIALTALFVWWWTHTFHKLPPYSDVRLLFAGPLPPVGPLLREARLQFQPKAPDCAVVLLTADREASAAVLRFYDVQQRTILCRGGRVRAVSKEIGAWAAAVAKAGGLVSQLIERIELLPKGPLVPAKPPPFPPAPAIGYPVAAPAPAYPRPSSATYPYLPTATPVPGYGYAAANAVSYGPAANYGPAAANVVGYGPQAANLGAAYDYNRPPSRGPSRPSSRGPSVPPSPRFAQPAGYADPATFARVNM